MMRKNAVPSRQGSANYIQDSLWWERMQYPPDRVLQIISKIPYDKKECSTFQTMLCKLYPRFPMIRKNAVPSRQGSANYIQDSLWWERMQYPPDRVLQIISKIPYDEKECSTFQTGLCKLYPKFPMIRKNAVPSRQGSANYIQDSLWWKRMQYPPDRVLQIISKIPYDEKECSTFQTGLCKLYPKFPMIRKNAVPSRQCSANYIQDSLWWERMQYPSDRVLQFISKIPYDEKEYNTLQTGFCKLYPRFPMMRKNTIPSRQGSANYIQDSLWWERIQYPPDRVLQIISKIPYDEKEYNTLQTGFCKLYPRFPMMRKNTIPSRQGSANYMQDSLWWERMQYPSDRVLQIISKIPHDEKECNTLQTGFCKLYPRFPMMRKNAVSFRQGFANYIQDYRYRVHMVVSVQYSYRH